MRRFPFDRLHHSARRQSRRHIQQQMHMIGSHMPLHDLDIQRSANLSRQVPHLFPDLSSQSRLAVLGDEHKVISQPIHCMRTFPILRHLRSVPPSLLKASPKGEGVHPSQSGTLRWRYETRFCETAKQDGFRRRSTPKPYPWKASRQTPSFFETPWRQCWRHEIRGLNWRNRPATTLLRFGCADRRCRPPGCRYCVSVAPTPGFSSSVFAKATCLDCGACHVQVPYVCANSLSLAN